MAAPKSPGRSLPPEPQPQLTPRRIHYPGPPDAHVIQDLEEIPLGESGSPRPVIAADRDEYSLDSPPFLAVSPGTVALPLPGPHGPRDPTYHRASPHYSQSHTGAVDTTGAVDVTQGDETLNTARSLAGGDGTSRTAVSGTEPRDVLARFHLRLASPASSNMPQVMPRFLRGPAPSPPPPPVGTLPPSAPDTALAALPRRLARLQPGATATTTTSPGSQAAPLPWETPRSGGTPRLTRLRHSVAGILAVSNAAPDRDFLNRVIGEVRAKSRLSSAAAAAAVAAATSSPFAEAAASRFFAHAEPLHHTAPRSPPTEDHRPAPSPPRQSASPPRPPWGAGPGAATSNNVRPAPRPRRHRPRPPLVDASPAVVTPRSSGIMLPSRLGLISASAPPPPPGPPPTVLLVAAGPCPPVAPRSPMLPPRPVPATPNRLPSGSPPLPSGPQQTRILVDRAHALLTQALATARPPGAHSPPDSEAVAMGQTAAAALSRVLESLRCPGGLSPPRQEPLAVPAPLHSTRSSSEGQPPPRPIKAATPPVGAARGGEAIRVRWAGPSAAGVSSPSFATEESIETSLGGPTPLPLAPQDPNCRQKTKKKERRPGRQNQKNDLTVDRLTPVGTSHRSKESQMAKGSAPVTPAAVGGSGLGSSGMLSFRTSTDDAPGFKVGPTAVLVMSFGFVGCVILLHIVGKLF
ncbi:hypothetical protein PAPYR_7685 [Paratrimastix pyriformis]|uniref:Protein transport protein Sec61 subunit beta n=1 Tax=Paratrimastix pyriformis TaxID=342808 RepID=A0ABQ8UJI8_9EUKA|nr:hypothetical protein PAPYR_7685 [Paratrimastix pyriformis]